MTAQSSTNHSGRTARTPTAPRRVRARALIADPDGLARNALREALTQAGLAVVGQAADAAQAVNLVQRCRPDVVVMDAELPPNGGLAALEAVSLASRGIRVVLLANQGNEDAGVVALEKGAAGYLPRELELAAVARAVVRVAAGEAAISRSMSTRVIERLQSRSRDTAGLRPIKSVLTTREWEVVDLMAAGASSSEIARALVLSPETVHSHVNHILRKLRAGSRAEAIEIAEHERAAHNGSA